MAKTGDVVRALLLVAAVTPASLSAAPPATAATLSVLTYNVEGLPWPVRSGRPADLHRMAQELAAMRAAGRAPQVVVMQEAFTAAAKAVPVAAGYRYVADGPARDDPGAPALEGADRAFAAAGSAFRGEHVGKWVDSGLRIASDYPIVAVRRMAFPSFACAGFDCLANKGVLMVELAVPGVPTPVAIVATHLNSRVAAGVDRARSRYAFRRQVDALTGFVRAEVPASVPFVFAGDFNAGQERQRRDYLVQRTAAWRTGGRPGDALDACLAPDTRCRRSDDADLRWSFRRGRDWQFFGAGGPTRLRVTEVAAPFGRAGGAMLSDHVGYVAGYRLSPIAAAAPRPGARAA